MQDPIDAKGKSCPLPIVLLAKAMRYLPAGEEQIILANDRAFPDDVEAWCSKTNNQLLSITNQAGVFEATIRKG